ncbi:MAG TPA: hypothetical protein VFE65_37130 [Pseudonocardia sp.]|nr:hypothetical protein [Pseudonocardia sp.]
MVAAGTSSAARTAPGDRLPRDRIPRDRIPGGRISRDRDTPAATALARKLAMPPKPVAREPGVAIGIGCGFLVIAFAILLVWGISTGNSGMANYVFLLANVLWIGWVVFCTARHLIAQRTASHNRRSWPQVQLRWEDLYYCHRDDLVFSGTDSSRHAVSAQMRSLLFADLDLV